MTCGFCASSSAFTADSGRVGSGRYVVSGGSGSDRATKPVRQAMLQMPAAASKEVALVQRAICPSPNVLLDRKFVIGLSTPGDANRSVPSPNAKMTKSAHGATRHEPRRPRAEAPAHELGGTSVRSCNNSPRRD